MKAKQVKRTPTKAERPINKKEYEKRLRDWHEANPGKGRPSFREWEKLVSRTRSLDLTERRVK